MPHPLYLESVNRIVKDTLLNKFKAEKNENVDITVADFNQCLWHVFGTTANRVLTVSVSCKCWTQLAQYGTMDYLKKIYGPMLQETPESNYDVTLSVDFDHPPESAATNPEPLCIQVASLLRNMMAGAFHNTFDHLGKAGANTLREIPYRPTEGLWLKPEGDRVMAIFSISFDDPDDQVIGKVFLQEFSKNVSGAPAVDIQVRDARNQIRVPLELQGIRGLKADGFATFVLESRHMNPKTRDQTINMLLQFRNYIHYHIKCSKAYLHIRMRLRVDLLLKVLNRAKQEKPDAEKKTKSGRTFTRT